MEHKDTKSVGWVSLQQWLETMSLSRTTGYRWRKRGWLKTTQIAGRHYLSPEQIEIFQGRAEAGEFERGRVLAAKV